MKNRCTILIIACFVFLLSGQLFAFDRQTVNIDFYGYQVQFSPDQSFLRTLSLNPDASEISNFLRQLDSADYQNCVAALSEYKHREQPDDWLFYQLIRKTAQEISPKSENYARYTLYKYFLMARSGYDVMLSASADKLLFYVQSNENIYNIPYRIKSNKTYICLNFHDYQDLNIEKERFLEIANESNNSSKSFSYKITHLPEFPKEVYVEKEINFNYYQSDLRLKVKVNPVVKNIFNNYPVVDYADYLNIPLSTITYQSLIPILKKELKGMSVKDGVDYLMRFTRYSFSFESDTKNFGKEKRLSPEQTLLYDKSDCDDRVALCYFLIKEIYNLPMIVVSYPQHVTLAIALDKPVGKPIIHNGIKYSICEPTPQKEDLPIGRTLPELRKVSYEVVYVYQPSVTIAH
jgi:hypothetical protein